MRVEIVAVGTELLLGQIPDTNSQWLGERLAANGIPSYFHQHVGDNHQRIVLAFRTALARSDAMIVCGGLGPTQDDITRAALAEVMNVPLDRDEAIVSTIRSLFESRGRSMPDNNLLQADVPRGATIIPQTRGTAPGLICNVGLKVVYAVPGVPYEMTDMFERAVLPDLLRRQREAGETSVIRSRVLRTWGASESALAEAVADRFDELEKGGRVTIAFLASGIEGIKVRLTARGDDDDHALSMLVHEEEKVRALIEEKLGDIIFATDDQSMEDVVASQLSSRALTLAVAESLTGGLIASRLVNVPGASAWFRGGVVSYASQVKFDVLGVPEGPVVSGPAAEAMARGVRELLKSDIGLSVTGVAGPEEQDGQVPGTVFVGLSVGENLTHSALRLPGDRPRIRAYSAISALDVLRRALERPEYTRAK
ncbi:MAG: competence/damage-inducible protein CinA-like protein [Acidimicrobiaceae bacterium]|nr:competence/damage-inducible protein CinA-like protein [Acidimicrobiaceae bacterium]